MNIAARIATIAMWVMIGAIILTFFTSSSWVRIVWVIAAVVCLISVLVVAYNKNRNRRRY
jgi:FtsH-binding integral membrane protein